MSLPAVSRQLKVLEHAGVISQAATRNGARLASRPHHSRSYPDGSTRTVLGRKLHRLDDYIIAGQRKEKSHARKGKKRR
jgi:hypothetical protein